MKKLLGTFTFSETTRRIVTYVIFLVFAAYTLWQLMHEPSTAGKVCYAFILIVFLGIAICSEYLKVIYQKMLRALLMETDPSLSRTYYHTLMKKDFFKSYRNSLNIFDTLYYQDIDQGSKCLEIMEKNDKFFRSSLDYLLIRNYTYFYTYYRTGNRTKVKQYYPEVMKLRGAKIKGARLHPLYNWEFIEAIYLLCTKEYKKSIKAFASVNPANMNQRELAQYYLEYGKACLYTGDKKTAKTFFEKANDAGSRLTYGKEARAFMEQC